MSEDESVTPEDRAPDTAQLPFFGPETGSTQRLAAQGPGDELEAASDGAGYDGEDGAGYDDDLDDEFAPQPKARLGKLTILLAAVLVAGVGFIGGVAVQKNNGTTTSGTGLAAAALARRGEGFAAGAGGFGSTGGGTGGGGTGTGVGGTGTGAGTGAGSTSTPAVIGTVVSLTGTTLVVKNFGGKLVTVTLSSTTTVTKPATAPDLSAGQTVSVVGTTGADGTVAATAVTSQ
jgi:hypothetical protein